MERIEIPWGEAKNLLIDADILLFRGNGIYSWWIKHFTRGIYSHAAIVGFCGNFIECIEAREWKGIRSVSLQHEVNLYPGQIDVYRLSSKELQPTYDLKTKKITEKEIILDGTTRRKIVNIMREWGGRDYGWGLIWKLAKQRLPVLRLFFSASYNDIEKDAETETPVCSTAVATAIRKYYIDILPNLSDLDVTPSDLSRSSATQYLFTLVS